MAATAIFDLGKIGVNLPELTDLTQIL